MMKRIKRVDQLKEPTIVGQYYIVPTIDEIWYGYRSHWPVIGPPHTDIEFFNFELVHYHIDGRFLSKRQLDKAEGYGFPSVIQSAPVHAPRYTEGAKLPHPVYKRLRCRSNHVEYVQHHQDPIKGIIAYYAGHQCDQGKAGWICPHRKASLGSINPINGIITCPLHGLQINAETGICLSRGN